MKLSRLAFTAAAAFTIAACGNISNVTDEGTPAGDTPEEAIKNLVWPKIEDNTHNHDGTQYGTWPNWDNVRMIERGMAKDQIRHLIGDPQAAEGLYFVREWDYTFNYRENGEHKICQYKVLFDKKMQAQSFFWYPNGCNGNAAYSLSGDFLFDFDKSTLTPKGQQVVDNIAAELKRVNSKSVKVSGFTDRLGSEEYNLKLSQRRADTVKARFIEQGLTAEIIAVGYGKAQQVKACDGIPYGQELKDCLRPNRRVEINASGSLVRDEKEVKVGGPTGPTPLYRK